MAILEVQGTYSFSVYPVAVLGTDFKNVLVTSLLDADSAQAMGLDILAMHAQVAPSLPGTIQTKDPTKYTYVRIKTPAGLSQIIALEWINLDTIEAINLGTMTVVLNNISSSRQNKLKQVLAANNFPVASITFTSATQSGT